MASKPEIIIPCQHQHQFLEARADWGEGRQSKEREGERDLKKLGLNYVC